jgi:hypothetical protein
MEMGRRKRRVTDFVMATRRAANSRCANLRVRQEQDRAEPHERSNRCTPSIAANPLWAGP